MVKWTTPFWRRRPVPALPDQRPVPFGYKVNWLALAADEPDDVIAALGMRDAHPVTWEQGLAESAGFDGTVFVTPRIGRFVLVIGVEMPSRWDSLVAMSARWGDAEYFGSHRVADYYSWALAQDGRLVRLFTYVGDEGAVEEEGVPTEVEEGFGYFGAKGLLEIDWDAEDLSLPQEDDVVDVATAWSIDPTFQDWTGTVGPGWLATWPAAARRTPSR